MNDDKIDKLDMFLSLLAIVIAFAAIYFYT